MITSWDDMPLECLLKIKTIAQLQLATEEEKNLRVAALLAGVDYDSILGIPLENVRELMDNTEFLLEKPVAKKAKRKYELNGRTYTLFKDPVEMTVAQYIDFQALNKEGFDKMPAELLSIFLIPKGHSYNDGYDKDQAVSDMLSMSVTEALGVVNFFTMRCCKSIKWVEIALKVRMRIRRLLAPKEQKEMWKATEIQLKTIMEASREMFGLLVWRP